MVGDADSVKRWGGVAAASFERAVGNAPGVIVFLDADDGGVGVSNGCIFGASLMSTSTPCIVTSKGSPAEVIAVITQSCDKSTTDFPFMATIMS